MTTSDGQGGDNRTATGKSDPQQSAGAAAEAPALAIIEAFGGIRPMAKMLGLAVSTVQGWKERSAIPANRHDQIRAAARDNNIAIDAAVLRASGGEGAGAPPQIIEGVAEETARGAPRRAAADPAPDKPSDKPSDQASKKAAGSQSSAATAAGARRAESSVAEPSVAGPPRRSGTFMPGLVLGVLLAVTVAAVTVYTRPYWGPLVEGPGGEAGALADLESRVAELRAAIPDDSSSALSDMSARIATLETVLSQGANQDPGTRDALESLSAELARMTDRIAALEQEVATLRSRGAAPSEEVISRLSGETQRLDTMLAQQTELAGRLAAAEANLNAAESARAGMPGGRETLLLLATLQLRDALQGSGPYAEPLAMLKNLADDEVALTSIVEPLERRAPAGLPTLRDLQAAFPDVARRIAAIETSQSGDGWTAGVLRRLSQVVNLRPVGLVEGEAPSAVAARAEVKLNDGDLAGALAELDALTGAAAEAAASWRADAEARQAAAQAVSQLGALVSERFSSMSGG